jgi:hypothetical protein
MFTASGKTIVTQKKINWFICGMRQYVITYFLPKEYFLQSPVFSLSCRHG